MIDASQITSLEFTAINRMKLGDNDNINKVFRLATAGGMDVTIRAWTDIGPILHIGCLSDDADDDTEMTDLQDFVLFSSGLTSALGGTWLHGTWLGLEDSGYATQAYVSNKISQLNFATQDDIDYAITQHILAFHS